jgi:hypothetical protein
VEVAGEDIQLLQVQMETLQMALLTLAVAVAVAGMVVGMDWAEQVVLVLLLFATQALLNGLQAAQLLV